MQMTFGRMSEPLTKVQKVDSIKTAQSYDFTYKYEDSNHPTAPTQIGHEHYTYNATGERIIKSHGDLEGDDDMPAHAKSSLFGVSLTIPITNGRLNLGTWQGIYLCEFRNNGGARKIVATMYG